MSMVELQSCTLLWLTEEESVEFAHQERSFPQYSRFIIALLMFHIHTAHTLQSELDN